MYDDLVIDFLNENNINCSKYPLKFYDDNGNEVYCETENGCWEKRIYDEDNNKLYEEDSNGYWAKFKYNIRKKVIYYENSYGMIKNLYK